MNAEIWTSVSFAGDSDCLKIIDALADGRAKTDVEIAQQTRLEPSVSRVHIYQLVSAGCLVFRLQRQRKYYSLHNSFLNALSLPDAAVHNVKAMRSTLLKNDGAFRVARMCYRHLGGRLAVALTQALVDQCHINLQNGAAELTASGEAFLTGLGVYPNRPLEPQQVLCKLCLDSSERRSHLSGAVGTALAAHGFRSQWIQCISGSRAVKVTAIGRHVFQNYFGISSFH